MRLQVEGSTVVELQYQHLVLNEGADNQKDKMLNAEFGIEGPYVHSDEAFSLIYRLYLDSKNEHNITNGLIRLRIAI